MGVGGCGQLRMGFAWLALALSVALLTACGGPPVLPMLDGSVDGSAPLPNGQILPGVWVAGTTTGQMRPLYFIDLPVSGTYIVEGDAPWLTFNLDFYSDRDRTQLVSRCAVVGVVDEGCVLSLSAGRHYLTLVPDYLGGSYSFVITPIVDEGTATNPAAPGPTDTVRHTVQSGDVSHYRFVATAAGAYDLRFVDLGLYAPDLYSTLRLEAYRGDGYGGELLATCQTGTIPPQPCQLSGVPSGPVSIRVVPLSARPGVFSLAPLRGLGEGAEIEPVAVDSVPHAGGVDEWSLSYYAFTAARDGVTQLAFVGGTVVDVEVFEDAVSTTPFTACGGALCSLSGLTAGTRYVAVVRGLYGTSGFYSVAVVPGVGVGTAGSRASFPVGVATDVALDVGGTNYYRATLPESGYYRFDTSSFAAGDTVTLTYPYDTYPTTRTCTLTTTSACDVGPRVSSLPFDFELHSSTGGTVRLTLVEEPLGEGVAADPVVIALDTPRSVDVHPTQDSYYRFDAGAAGGDQEVLFFSTESLDTTFAPFNVAQCRGTATTRLCTLRNLAPNQIVDFHIGPYGSATGAVPVQFVWTRQATTGGCEVGALACYDFESGAIPAGFTEPATSVRPFRVLAGAALSGGYGFAAGAMSPSCFTFGVGATAHAVTFDHDVLSSQTADALDVRVDGSYATSIAASTAVDRRRSTVPVVAGTTHTLEFCFTYSGSGAHAYVDDVAVR